METRDTCTEVTHTQTTHVQADNRHTLTETTHLYSDNKHVCTVHRLPPAMEA